MKTRVISAIAIAAAAIVLIYLGGHFVTGAVLFLAAVGLHEFYNTFKEKGIKPIKSVGALYLLYIVAFFFTNIFNISALNVTAYSIGNSINLFALLQYVIVAALLCTVVFKYPKYTITDAAVTVFGGYYVVILFSYLVLLDRIDGGTYLIVLALLGCIAADSFALFSGMLFGKKKLAPELSPKKTVAGSVGAFVGSIAVLLIYGAVITLTGLYTAIPLYHYAILGVAIGGIAQIGDLSASAIKRYTGIKDFGNIIPGHGGVLDRCDSYLIVAPFVYYYLNLFVF